MVEITKEVIELFDKTPELSLALFNGEYPYIIPVNFVYLNEKIYIHTGYKTKKIALIQANPNVAFSAYYNVQVMPELSTTFFKSLIGKAKAEIVENSSEKSEVLTALAQRYQTQCEIPSPIQKINKTAVIALNIIAISYRNKNKLKADG